jgi:hypothetical protein
LPPSITDPNDSDPDTEPEDEADEDSNGLFLVSNLATSQDPNCSQRKSIIRTTIQRRIHLRVAVMAAVRHSPCRHITIYTHVNFHSRYVP